MKDIAVACNRSVPTIRRWIRDEKVPYAKKKENARGRLLFTLEEKEAFVSYATGVNNG